MYVQFEDCWSACYMEAYGFNQAHCMSDDHPAVGDHPALLYCHCCSRAAQSRAQAIRELPLLPLTSLTRFADNTHTFLFFLLFLCLSVPLSFLSFPFSVPFSAYVCERGILIL